MTNLTNQIKQVNENFIYESTSNLVNNRETTENNIRTALVGGDIPYQIPLGGDNWCNYSGAVHQLVPGCGRICSDSEGYWVKDDPNRQKRIPWSHDLKSTCEGALLRTIWKPDPNNPNLRKLAVGEPSRSDYPRPVGNKVPYLEHGISGIGQCQHDGSIVQAVPGCGLVCSDPYRVMIISPFKSDLNIGWDTWENNEKKIGCNGAKLGLIWGYTTDNSNPKRRQFLLGDAEKNHATRKITQQERAALCGTMTLMDPRTGRIQGTTSLGQVASRIDWYTTTQKNDPQFKSEHYRRGFTYCGGLGNAQDVDCRDNRCIKPTGYRRNPDIRED